MSFPSKLARRLPPAWARFARRAYSRPRYWMQWWRARFGEWKHGSRYHHPTLFIAGLPKSGTSWLESMLATYPGYIPIMPPKAVEYEYTEDGSHRFRLPEDLFRRLEPCLTVLKLHVEGSDHNRRVIHEAGLPYVILFRDLRDVAVSHYYYVRRTVWHPEHPTYTSLGVEEGLLHFANSLLGPFGEWIEGWLESRDRERSIVVRYEDMLSEPKKNFAKVAAHFGLDTSPSVVHTIVEAHTFERMSGGRQRGSEDRDSFIRKGVAGDWRNHFSDKVTRAFKSRVGSLLMRLGYEDDSSWTRASRGNRD